MKIDNDEMVSVVSAGGTTNRVDLYVGIHKAMRFLMADLLVAVGKMDASDDSAVEWIGSRVLQFADFCTSHLTHENDFVHTALEARLPGASARIATEHVEHEQAIAALKAAAGQLQKSQGSQREHDALALYRQLALFIAHNFEHMQAEEIELNQALWAHYTDEELLALHGRLLATIPPEETLFVMRWMVPAMTPAERLQLLQGMQAHAPAPAFAVVLDVVQPHLSTGEWAKLARGLKLAPTAGLMTA